MNKKILILGGAFSQVPAIKRAKELGYYVITCDYLPNNPGHAYSEQYENISTVEIDNVLKFAKESAIDGIIAYASDPAAETAASVSQDMQLACASAESTVILAEKDKFREFQHSRGLRAPKYCSITSKDNLKNIANHLDFPCFIKPVDSSGSKGINKVNNESELEALYEYALNFSRNKRVIIEEAIESDFNQLHGDGVVYNGELIFLELGEQRFYHNVPIGSSCPALISDEIIKKAKAELVKTIKEVGFKLGGINVEIRIDKNNNPVILEIGPRTGGNYIPQLMEISTGFKEMDAVLEMTMGDFDENKYCRGKKSYCFQYIIGSRDNGLFKELFISDEIKPKIKELYIHKKAGDEVLDYSNSSGVVGVAIMEYKSKEEMEYFIANILEHISVIVEK